MLHSVARWWDGVELWIAGLPFVPQVVVLLVTMVPISYAIAITMDRLSSSVSDWLSVKKKSRRAATLLSGDGENGIG